MKRCIVPAREARSEIVVVNSRFIATMSPAFTVEEAKAFIACIKWEFADATHNVSAYIIGHGATVTAHSNDDGEPAGTAGRPALAVLQGSGLGDAVVVVTRYFGGTKLGLGGLVRAYGDAVRQVLSVMPRAAKVPTHTILLAMPYSVFERVRLLIAAHGGLTLDEDFGGEIILTAQFAVEDLAPFQDALQEMSGGKLKAEIVETNRQTIMPIDTKVTDRAHPAG